MKKIIWSILFLSILVALGGGIYYKKIEKEKVARDNVISLGKCVIDIESVATDELRRKGLSNRDSLCENCGMLFLFQEKENYSFWMKDMRFPIDMIWLRDNKVVDISQDISHKSKSVHTSKEKVDKVLELNANAVTRCKIEVGTKLKN
jgi:uncharacterized protein